MEPDEEVASDWSIRPWARSFDLISSEYGWTDDEILNCTLARIRQMTDVILTRKNETVRSRLRVEETEMRALMVSIHGAAGNKKGVRQAQKWKMLATEAAVPTLAAAQRLFPVDEALGGLITEDQIAERRRELGLSA